MCTCYLVWLATFIFRMDLRKVERLVAARRLAKAATGTSDRDANAWSRRDDFVRATKHIAE